MIEAKECTREMLLSIIEQGGETLGEMSDADLSHSVAVLVDGRPIAVGGIHTIWDRVGEAWTILLDESLTEYKTSTAKHIKRYLDKNMVDFGRVQMVGRADNPSMLSRAKFLGFEVNGELTNFGPGAEGNYWLFGRVN